MEMAEISQSFRAKIKILPGKGSHGKHYKS